MGFRVKRKTYEMGFSRGVTLPKAWIDFHGRGKTNEVTLIGDAILIIAPKGYESKAQGVIAGLEGEGINLNGEQESLDLDSLSVGWPPEDNIERNPSQLALFLGVPAIRVRAILRERGYSKPSNAQQWGNLTPQQQHEVRETLRKPRL